MKKLVLVVLVVMAMVSTACTEEAPAPTGLTAGVENILVENILVEEILVENIEVEEITVKPISRSNPLP